MEYYIPISRRLFEHQLWCEERIYSRFEAWLDLIQSARFEDTKQLIGNRFIEVKRRQMLASLRFLAGRWQWSTKKVNSFLDLLIQDKMIIKETPKETGQTVITICNYDKYNSQIIQEETEKKQQGNTKETPRKQQGNKVNKDKKENNIGDSDESLVCGTSQPHAEHIDYSELVKFFNEETKGVFGTVRTPLSDSRKGMINARIKSYGKKTFADMIHRAYQSDFLKGQNKKGWTASFDWLIKPTNFEKVISGNYDNKNSRNYPAIPNGAKSREEQTDREILEYAAKAFGKDTVSSK